VIVLSVGADASHERDVLGVARRVDLLASAGSAVVGRNIAHSLPVAHLGDMALRKPAGPGGMTLRNCRHALLLVAACCCKSGGGMILRKSAFRWRHEFANWHAACCVVMAARRPAAQRADYQPRRP
jgi:hypothetical protein